MGKRILIVDDEKDIVLVLKIALKKEGFEISEAYDGLEALEKVNAEKPDLILLDIMMPKMDGHSVNLKLKENPETARIPVIVITGRGQLKELIQAREGLTIVAYLEKPFTVASLLEKIREAIPG
ncbi:MAG: response regulator [Endomicrobiales bacterium]|nr:response regulator [Endomicrobiales bacterium]